MPSWFARLRISNGAGTESAGSKATPPRPTVVNGLMPETLTSVDLRDRALLIGQTRKLAVYDIQPLCSFRSAVLAEADNLNEDLPSEQGLVAWRAVIPEPTLLRSFRIRGEAANAKFVSRNLALVAERPVSSPSERLRTASRKNGPVIVAPKGLRANLAKDASVWRVSLQDLDQGHEVMSCPTRSTVSSIMTTLTRSLIGLDSGIALLDPRSGELRPACYDSIHKSPVTAISDLLDSRFVTGDAEGIVAIWDQRFPNLPIQTSDARCALLVGGDVPRQASHKVKGISVHVADGDRMVHRDRRQPIMSLKSWTDILIRDRNSLRVLMPEQQQFFKNVEWYAPLSGTLRTKLALSDRQAAVIKFGEEEDVWVTSTGEGTIKFINLRNMKTVAQLRGSSNAHALWSEHYGCLVLSDGVTRPISVVWPHG